MHSFPATKATLGMVVLLTIHLLLPNCDASSTVDHREPTTKRAHGEHLTKLPPPPPLKIAIDSKAKLVGFNRELSDRLRQTQTGLRPLQTRAAKLQRRFDSAKVSHRPTAAERHGLLREARQLRSAIERKLQGFGALERKYQNMRGLLPSGATAGGGVPRAWLDHDTERQMEVNERVYKNIIQLLVHLIECPVNIIHDIVGPTTVASTPTTTTFGPEYYGEQEDNGTLGDEDESLYNVNVTGPGNEVGEPWLEEFHY